MIYAAVDNGGQLAGLFRSANSGANWTALDTPQTNEGGVIVGLQPEFEDDEEAPGGQGGTHLSMVADPGNANLVYLGGDRQPTNPGADGILGNNDDTFPNSIGANDFSGRLFRCNATLAAGAQCGALTHNGTNNNSAPHADSRDLEFDANGTILETDDGGIYRRNNPQGTGGGWTSVIGNLSVTETHSCGYDHIAHVGICGDQDTGVPEQPSQGALTWREVTTADGGIVAVDDVAAPSTRYFSNQNLGGFTRRSCNATNVCSNAAPSLNVVGGGNTLPNLDTTIQFYNPLAANSVASGRVVIANNTVYESTDRADNLTPLTGFTGAANRAIAYGGRVSGTDNPDLLYVGSSSGLFVRTAAGNSIARSTAYPGGQPVELGIEPENGLSAYVIDNNSVFHTTDAGTTWTNLTGDLAAAGAKNLHTVAFIPTADASYVALGADDGVYVSQSQQFGHWAKLSAPLPTAIAYHLDYDRTDDVLMVATMGRATWILGSASTLLPHADLEVTKSDHPDPVHAGEELFYDITVTNHGPDTAVATKLTDVLPPEVTYLSDNGGCTFDTPSRTLSCDLGDLANGATKTITIKTIVKSGAVANESDGTTLITNTATVSSLSVDLNLANNAATATTFVQELANLAVTKLCQPDFALRAGETGTCTVFVDNDGPSAARNVVMTDTHVSNGSFTFGAITPSQGTCDPPAGGVITCHLGTIAAASPASPGRATVTIQLTANEALTIDDTARAVADTPDPDTSNNQAHDTISISAVADLALTKTGPAIAVAGTNITYNLSTTNNGPSTATGVTINDNLDSHVHVVSVTGSNGATCNAGVPGDSTRPTTCNFGTLAPGAARTMQIVVTVDPAATGILHNDARVSSQVFDNNTANDLAHVDTTVQTSADVSLSIAATPNPATAGEALSYQLTVANTGPSVARNVVLTDLIPANLRVTSFSVSSPLGSCDLQTNTNIVQCQLGDIDPGRNAVISIFTVIAPSTLPGNLINAASVTSTTPDPNTANNSASVTTPIITKADLAITLASDADIYKPSSIIHYTITVVNNGPSDAQNVVVTQVLPDPKTATYDSNSAGCPTPTGNPPTFTCSLGKIVAGGSKSFQLNILIRGNKRTITQTATVTSTTTDPMTPNNTSTRVVTVK